jgi:hypothetical protein
MEDAWVSSSSLSTSSSPFVLDDNTTDDCWYEPFLRRSSASIHLVVKENDVCFSHRVFDFSDHMVLYYAQILPIATAEVLYQLVGMILLQRPARMHNRISSSSSSQQQRPGTTLWWYGILITCYVGYLLVIVAHAAYMTASYFHTASEVYVGWMVSWLVSVPLAMVQLQQW